MNGTLHVGVLRAVLHLHGARSLKDRRRVVVGLRDRVRHRFDVSCNEVILGEMPTRGALVVTTGGAAADVVASVMEGVRTFILSQGAFVVSDLATEVIAWQPDRAMFDAWASSSGESEDWDV